MKLKFLSIVILSFLATASIAHAGIFGEFVKRMMKGSADNVATRNMQTTAVKKTIMRRDAMKAAVASGGLGILAGAGWASSEIPEERAAVQEEIKVAIENKERIYRARICLHPKKKEFYTVPSWAEYCPDGKKSTLSAGVDLSSYHSDTSN